MENTGPCLQRFGSFETLHFAALFTFLWLSDWFFASVGIALSLFFPLWARCAGFVTDHGSSFLCFKVYKGAMENNKIMVEANDANNTTTDRIFQGMHSGVQGHLKQTTPCVCRHARTSADLQQ